MSERLKKIRKLIVERLKDLGSIHSWSHIEKQIGMFAYTGLKEDMVEELKRDYSIYLPVDGRVSLASLNQNNIEYFCQAVHQVSKDKAI
jgi:aspartate/tyrosine/aromatic aminotransferase